MPIPIASLIQSGASLLGGSLNALSQRAQNRRSERFTREMYDKTNQQNLSNWRLQNEYNSPQATMQRFQEAGLNKHLIYGQNSASAPVPTPDLQTPQFRAPEWGNGVSAAGLTGINSIYDIQIKQAQIDNLKTQNTVLLEEQRLKAAQTRATMTAEQRANFDLMFETEMRSTSADARRENLRQTKTYTDNSIDANARAATLNASNVNEALERMLTLQEQRKIQPLERARLRENISLMKQDGTLKTIEIELRNAGVNPNDPMWARYIGLFISKLIDPAETRKPFSIWDWIFNK